MKETLLPAVGKVLFDHAPSVRKQLSLTLAAWFERLQDTRVYEATLLPLLLSGVVDESPEVREITLTKIGELAIKWEGQEHDTEATTMEVDSEISPTPPGFFPARPPLGVRLLASRFV